MIDIQVTGRERVTLIEVKGRVDSMSADQLGDSLTKAIDSGRAQIVLDLAGVEYMSSAGLREIVSALKRAQRSGTGAGDIRIAQPSYRVREVLEMAGLDTVLQIYSTQVEAVGSY